MGWQANLPCYSDKPVKVAGLIGRWLQCTGHMVNYTDPCPTYHTTEIYWQKEANMLTDDWGFLIPSIVDNPDDFDAGKMVCISCGCYVHRDKRETHREKCNFV